MEPDPDPDAESAFEQHLQGATIEDVRPVQRDELTTAEAGSVQAAPYGLKKDGTPKSPPGRKPTKTIKISAPIKDSPAKPPVSVARPEVLASPETPAHGEQLGYVGSAEPIAVARKAPFLFTLSDLPVTQSDRKDRAIRHQLLFAGVVRLSSSALDRVPPSPNVVNPLAALIALKEEREQALFLPNVMMGVALSQVVAAVVLAKPIGDATQIEIDAANKAYDDLLKTLNF